ncbi:MAG: Rne/Rng family ribonuclease [Ignavibacteriota bacterium]
MVQFRKEIIINARMENEVRIAITENGRLVELFVENPETVRHVGEIFLGKVAKVIPGMNAAFINVGLAQDAFLHFSDVGDSFDGSMSFLASEGADMRDDDDDSEDDEFDEDDHEEPAVAAINDGPPQLRLKGSPDDGTPRVEPRRESRPAAPKGPRRAFSTLEMPNIDLEPGQNILVQVTREAFANKGVRVTSRISLPGRFLVLVPFEPGIGISKKVFSVRERRRLRKVIRSLKPKDVGVIIRTVAENKEESALREDLQNLINDWNSIQQKIKDKEPPLLAFQDTNITNSVLRDLFSNDITKIVVDDKKMYREVLDYIQWASPNLAGTVEQYKETVPVFDTLGIEEEIEQTMSRKVLLPSGGYLFIEKTEAMVVIDVNSGRYAARREQELNSLKTNLESAREIARQLRLRDIGGIIVVDFIDMIDERNKKKVYDEMKKELRRDRAKSSILPLTDFGLMQITRQRIRQSLGETMSDQCSACGGTGMLVSQTSVIHQIERWLERFKTESSGGALTLRVNPLLHEPMAKGFLSPWRKMKMRVHVRAKLLNDDSLRGDEFRFINSSGKDITPEFLGQKPQPEVAEAPPPQNGAAPRRKEGRYNNRGRGNNGGGGDGNRPNNKRQNRQRPDRREDRR